MSIIIMLLYIATMVNFMIRWTEAHSQFVRNGQSFWTKFLCYSTSNATVIIGASVPAAISTMLADSTIVRITAPIFDTAHCCPNCRFGVVG